MFYWNLHNYIESRTIPEYYCNWIDNCCLRETRARFIIIMQVPIKHWFSQTFNSPCTYRVQQYDLMEHTFECGLSGGFGFVDYGFNIDNPYVVYNLTNISSIQCYTIRKLTSRNQGYQPTFSLQSNNLSTIAYPIQRRQSESVRSIAGAHKHRPFFVYRLFLHLSLLSTSFIYSLRSVRQRQWAAGDRKWQLRQTLLSVIANVRLLF
jgi:hypothetical protein